ncbi:hypothetical protein [Mucilaginibacter flavidus]|uniref:hypothetical protein n=1 Tax=Mucilaginibacter flavidus TaxID=2949309 RepID=UPI002093F445|nr:hypothetical protein [Mucilaginibacter flavidus]MCO5950740.1 hypothetical protein [Mucilaginibacter flavidus]
MTSEFTDHCTQYYHLTKLLSAQDERFKNLLDNAPAYTGQRNLSELDPIIGHNRKVHAAKARVDKTFKTWQETAHSILKMMQYFDIPPRAILTGQIPGELEYELWANEKDEVYIIKARDLPQEAVNPNIIVINCWNGKKSEEDD